MNAARRKEVATTHHPKGTIMKKIFYRQGDVGLQLVASLPANAVAVKPTEPHRIVLAYGEVTGHAHALHEVTKVREFSYEAERFIQVMETTSLKHEEHAPILLAPGVYQVIQQVEYSPEEIRNVAD